MVLAAIRVYRWGLSPMKAAVFGPLGRCRFTPSCSAYALEAVRIHGAGRGAWLAVRRLCRCHPWGGCGHDPVPEAESQRPEPEGQSAMSNPQRLKAKVWTTTGTESRRWAVPAPGTPS
ncbi:MAG: membrane protein insertion efficiency factor YidD [Verrucomicrobia bacterium]|nr:membrane protein insertion efficiency factor YidD [Verrucomicrobiota bacterium]